MYIYIYIYIYMYVCIYIYIHIYIYTHIYIRYMSIQFAYDTSPRNPTTFFLDHGILLGRLCFIRIFPKGFFNRAV